MKKILLTLQRVKIIFVSNVQHTALSCVAANVRKPYVLWFVALFYYTWQSAIFLREIHETKISSTSQHSERRRLFSLLCVLCMIYFSWQSAIFLKEIHETEVSSNTSQHSERRRLFSLLCVLCMIYFSWQSAIFLKEIHETEVSSNTSQHSERRRLFSLLCVLCCCQRWGDWRCMRWGVTQWWSCAHIIKNTTSQSKRDSEVLN